VHTKRGQSDLVTAADLASEAAMLEVLGSEAPKAGVLSEESGFRAGASSDVWVIDPLDGTVNYAVGTDDFGVVVGLVRDGEPLVGGMFLPTRGALYLASRGSGAFRDGSRLAVSPIDRVEDAVFDHSLAPFPEIEAAQRRTLHALIRSARGVRCAHSLTYLARVAEGVYDGFVYHSLGLWDICGPSVVLEEAGAVLATPDGGRLDLRPTPDAAGRMIAVAGANPRLLASLLETIR